MVMSVRKCIFAFLFMKFVLQSFSWLQHFFFDLMYFWEGHNFAKSPHIICPMYCQSNIWWRFCRILWSSQNIWTLPRKIRCQQYSTNLNMPNFGYFHERSTRKLHLRHHFLWCWHPHFVRLSDTKKDSGN